jgi:hypothetical protein
MTDRIAELTRELIAEIDREHKKNRRNGSTFTPIMRYNMTIMTMHEAGCSAEKITNILRSKFKFSTHRSTVARLITRLKNIHLECE